jgi:molybdopterin converting factor small subunit
MNIRVRLFARARDLAGRDMLHLELMPGATIGDARHRLAAACPELATILPRCALAVNDEFADDAVRIATNAEIACLPPVSGGGAK